MTTVSALADPESFFGFRPGTNRKLIAWERLLDYYQQIAESSARVAFEEIGRSTEGRPLAAIFISSEENIGRLDELKALQQRLADPRTIDAGDEQQLIEQGRAIVVVHCGIHPQEVGAGLMAPLVLHDLATRGDAQAQHILDNVVLIMIPSMNPDGWELVREWYEKTLGTPAEGTWPPSITHKYVGGENNRDWFAQTQAENRAVASRIYNQWFPHLVVDLHQMGLDGFRFIVPPYADPPPPNVDPVIVSESSRVGSMIAARMTAAGHTGVATQVLFDAFAADRTYPQFHGGIYILTECASCDIATTSRIEPSALRSQDGFDPRQRYVRHPAPWPGGEWSVADIVDYNWTVVSACLDDAADNRQRMVSNFFGVQQRAVSADHRRAFVIPSGQQDQGTVLELVEMLRAGLVEVEQATEPFEADGIQFPAGSFIVPLAQPFGNYAAALLELRNYTPVFLYPEGPPRPPYDLPATYVPGMLGVRVESVGTLERVNVKPVPTAPAREGAVHGDGSIYLSDPGINASAKAVNQLLASNSAVRRTTEPLSNGENSWPAGTFAVQGVDRNRLEEIARTTGTAWYSAPDVSAERLQRLTMPRVGVYRSYMSGFGVCDEGWLRFVLDSYGFPYRNFWNEHARFDDLNSQFDVIILPQQLPRDIIDGFDPRENPGTITSSRGPRFAEHDQEIVNPYPARYVGGIGERGLENLRRFTEAGGTLIGLDTASDVVIKALRLPVENVAHQLPRSDFFVPGSMLRLHVNRTHPLAYGYQREASAFFLNSPLFRNNGEGAAVATYPQDDQLISGWLHGGEQLKGMGALLDIPVEQGRAVLIGFRPHYRAQARVSYRFLFNAIYYAGLQVARQP